MWRKLRVRLRRGPPEVLDLRELSNLANNAQYDSTKSQLRKALQQWMENTGDPLAVNGHDPWDDFPYGGPVQSK